MKRETCARRTSSIIGVGLLLVGCGASFDKIGDGAPERLTTITTSSGPCLQVWFDTTTPEEAHLAESALEAVCGVLDAPGFDQALANTVAWTDGRGGVRPVCPADVLAEVKTLHAKPVHLIAAPVAGANATSLLYVNEQTKKPTTGAPGPRDRAAINIDAERLHFWVSPKPKDRACLIDTLAHELTHLLPVALGSFEQKYQDRVKSGRDRMASYSFGHAAGCFFLQRPSDCPEMLDCPKT